MRIPPKRWHRPAPLPPSAGPDFRTALATIRAQARSLGLDLDDVPDATMGAAMLRANAAHGPDSPNPDANLLMAEFLERVSGK